MALEHDYKAIVERYIHNNKGKDLGEGSIRKDSSGSLSDLLNSYTHVCPDDAYDAINSMIGLNNIKTELGRINDRYRFYQASGAVDNAAYGHMCFYGPPGTGKTSVARIIGTMLYDAGFIRRKETIEIDGAFLRRCSGSPSEYIEKIAAKASGGVLFIDEAYSVALGALGYELIASLTKIMEDYRDELVVIFAGYVNEMRDMIMTNPGLRSRIKTELYFEPYGIEDLMAIFYKWLRNGSPVFNIERGAANAISDYVQSQMSRQDFANAREMRNIYESLIGIHASNYYHDNGNSDRNMYVITTEDAQAFVTEKTKISNIL